MRCPFSLWERILFALSYVRGSFSPPALSCNRQRNMVRWFSMSGYFYIDANGQQQGPVSKRRLQILAARGAIEPNTPIETFAGHKCSAEQIPSLWNRSLTNESSGSPNWGLTIFLTFLTCVIVILGAMVIAPIFLLFVPAAIPFLLFMRLLFYIESHLRGIREHYENE